MSFSLGWIQVKRIADISFMPYERKDDIIQWFIAINSRIYVGEGYMINIKRLTEEAAYDLTIYDSNTCIKNNIVLSYKQVIKVLKQLSYHSVENPLTKKKKKKYSVDLKELDGLFYERKTRHNKYTFNHYTNNHYDYKIGGTHV